MQGVGGELENEMKALLYVRVCVCVCERDRGDRVMREDKQRERGDGLE